MLEQKEMDRIMAQDRGERRLTDADKETMEAQLNLSEVQNNELKDSDSVEKEFVVFGLKDETNELQDFDGNFEVNDEDELFQPQNEADEE